ncbi:tryptophan synthase subunit alpha [Bacillus sp. FJAT-42376]|uniref:tryptophan synthase subunit alpha n=1 Tax=Bacillus sp. FJAT-42376 TaxID=2014076 RepID=UPI000F4DADD2|nr:tryptophan synthase subunit alpha [Bacillus sp. FJAT-42376]AZB43328.1 tryptophan synthase subunit alpha [Bacillus sp. FJAT-42376]
MNYFQSLLEQNKKLFIPFITAGDPSPAATIDLALSLQNAGADAIELGIPYSDPLADGPVIQRASARALKQGMNIVKAMELVPQMRENGVRIPIILFTYYNPVLQLGEENFFALMRENDVNGLLVPDLPFEENERMRERCKAENLYFISMVAPTSSSRLKKIAQSSEGFLYCVSSLGVTGERKAFNENVFEFIKEVKAVSPIPVAVGFGISSGEQAMQMNEVSDGVVVGSAIIRQVEELQDELISVSEREQALQKVEDFARSFVHTV